MMIKCVKCCYWFNDEYNEKKCMMCQCEEKEEREENKKENKKILKIRSVSTMFKFKNCENMVFNQNGKSYDFDRYNFEKRTPMSTQDWSIVVSFQNIDITGNAIRYGSWDNLTIQECLEALETLEPHEINRDFSHMLTPEVYQTLGIQEEPPTHQEEEEEERQLYDEDGEPIDIITEGELVYTEDGNIFALDEMILDNEKIGVKFMRTYENKADGWKAYEFETDENIEFEFYGTGGSLFRLEIGKDYKAVCVAYSEDYTVMENVTDYFDIDDLMKRMEETPDIYNEQEEYENR